MTKVLVVYTIQSKIIEDMAKSIGEELGKDDLQVEVRRLDEVGNLEAYDLVIRAQTEERRNGATVREWAGGLARMFAATRQQS